MRLLAVALGFSLRLPRGDGAAAGLLAALTVPTVLQDTEPTAQLSVSELTQSHLHTWLSHVLSGDDCANQTAQMLDELHHSYTARMVPDVLRDECDQFIYYEKFGSKKEVCHAIVENLIHTWKG